MKLKELLEKVHDNNKVMYNGNCVGTIESIMDGNNREYAYYILNKFVTDIFAVSDSPYVYIFITDEDLKEVF